MKYCNSCGEIIKSNEEFHVKCLKKLFGTTLLPGLDWSLSEISIKAQEMAGRLSISGVQPKLSLKLDKKNNRLEISKEEGEYILKPKVERFNNIPQNENLCMILARRVGIAVPPHALINFRDKSLAYIIKRFDRTKKVKLHQEDFLQILGEADKYKGSMEKIGHKLNILSDFPKLDLQLLFERMVFFFIIGNGDAHLKNFSVLYHNDGTTRLSPAYDILSSKLVIPSEEDTALSINGKKNKITGNDFMEFAKKFKIQAQSSFERISKGVDSFFPSISNSHLSEDEQVRLQEIIRERRKRLLKR